MSKYALISVSDKTGITDLARTLVQHNYKILSTGGTASQMRDAGIDVTDVSDYTGFPEMMDGRVKTLHPKVHGGLLARRNIAEHMQSAKEHGIEMIDILVINLYPFEATINKEGVRDDEVIENIDIGGPGMVRAGAKNHESVTVVTSPSQYEELMAELNERGGETSPELRIRFAVEAYSRTAYYDSLISAALSERLLKQNVLERKPEETALPLRFQQEMRYGENPHQQALFYLNPLSKAGSASAKQLHGKELSFNNIYDMDAAFALAAEFSKPAVAVIKHTNPCGCAVGETIEEAYANAYKTDTLSAFGGVYGINREVSAAIAEELNKIFVEVVIAPSYSEEALRILTRKKNIRLLTANYNKEIFDTLSGKFVQGGVLLQQSDLPLYNENDFKVVTKVQPTKEQLEDLLFGFTVCKHVKSNAIVFARGGKTIGVGAGQMSRVDSVKIATEKRCEDIEGAVMASDAFFPFRDAIDAAAEAGIKAIIQPGGSIKDADVIEAADESGLTMIFTGMRHFRH